MLLFLPSHRQPRSGLPLRGSPPRRESGAHAALSCSPARRRRKLIGFLRRERRFDVVSYNVLAPYFKLPPNTLLESFRIVFLSMWFLCLTHCQNDDYGSGNVVLISLMVGNRHWVFRMLHQDWELMVTSNMR